MNTNYTERLEEEIRHVPEEYLPALWNIVHSFRESVSFKNAEDSVKQGWKEAMNGETHPIDSLWDGVETQ